MKIPRFTAEVDFDVLKEALDDAGCRIVTGASNAALCREPSVIGLHQGYPSKSWCSEHLSNRALCR
ncbi:hypothetical protein NBRC116588_14470 [Pyruvatibacter sp. HU-CL02332]